MHKAIQKTLLGFIALLCFTSNLHSALAADDINAVLAEAKSRYAQFQKTVQDMTVSEEMTLFGDEGRSQQKAKVILKGVKYRVEGDLNFSASGGAAVPTTILFDGKNSWVVSFFIEKRTLADLESKPYHRDTYFWEKIAAFAKPLRQELVGNYDCIVVEVKDEHGVPINVWIEKKSFNLIEAELKTPHILWWFSDSRDVVASLPAGQASWQVPYTIEIYNDNAILANVYVKSIEINKTPSEDLFNPEKISAEEVSEF